MGGRDPRYYQIVQFSKWEVAGWNDGELICFPCFCQREVVSEDEKLEPTQGVSCWGCISHPLQWMPLELAGEMSLHRDKHKHSFPYCEREILLIGKKS